MIIFDFDGTLFHTMPAMKEGIRKTLIHMNEELLSHEYIEDGLKRGLSLVDTFHHLIAQPKYPLLDYVECYRELYGKFNLESLVVPYPFVSCILKQLSQADIPLIILSNKGEPAIWSLLEKHHLQNYFSLIIGQRNGLKPKPSTDSYRFIIQPLRQKLNQKKIYMVGDTKNDMIFSQKIGAAFLWASYGYGCATDISKQDQSTIQLTCFSELVTSLK